MRARQFWNRSRLHRPSAPLSSSSRSGLRRYRRLPMLLDQDDVPAERREQGPSSSRIRPWPRHAVGRRKRKESPRTPSRREGTESVPRRTAGISGPLPNPGPWPIQVSVRDDREDLRLFPGKTLFGQDLLDLLPADTGKAQDLAAGPDRRQDQEGVGGDQDDMGEQRRLLQDLEERVGCVRAHFLGLFDDEHPLRWPKNGFR